MIRCDIATVLRISTRIFHWSTVLGAPGITRDGMADHIYLVLQGDHDWHMQRTGKYEQNLSLKVTAWGISGLTRCISEWKYFALNVI